MEEDIVFLRCAVNSLVRTLECVKSGDGSKGKLFVKDSADQEYVEQLMIEWQRLVSLIVDLQAFIRPGKDDEEVKLNFVPRYKKCEKCGNNLCNHGTCDSDDCDQCHEKYLASRGTHYYCPECREMFNGNKTLKEAAPYTPPTIREEDRKWGLYWWDEGGVEHAMLGGKIHKRVPQGWQSVEEKE